MNDDQALSRPIGWWLKQADVLLDAAFDDELVAAGASRRDWQILTSLVTGAKPREQVIASLTPFDPGDVVSDVVEQLSGRGWVEDRGGSLHLTPAGSRRQQALAPRVGAVRNRISTALPEDDYVLLVRLLARLVDALQPPARRPE